MSQGHDGVGEQYAVVAAIFDAQFYATASGVSVEQALPHYLSSGGRSEYDPHPLFDTSFYLEYNPDVAAGGVNPLVHYLTAGYREGRWPNPLFDPTHYANAAGSIPADTSPLLHYLRQPVSRPLATHALFDPAFYIAGAPEAAAHPWKPLGHYLAARAANPHPLFDIAFYRAQCDGACTGDYDPLSDYLLYGVAARRNPHPLFDTEYYLSTYTDIAAASLNPLAHFCAQGAWEGRNPHPWFDVRWYLERHPEVATSGRNALIDYIREGAAAGREPHPLFRTAHWAAIRGRSVVDGAALLADFTEQVRRSGKSPLEVLQFRDRRRPALSTSARPGLNVIGWPRLEMGVAQCLRHAAMALHTTPVPFSVRDVSPVPPNSSGDDSVTQWIQPDCPHNTNLFVINADNMQAACSRIGSESVRDRFNIAMWFWELAEFPEAWVTEMSVLDEIWACSLYNQQVFARKSPVPVVHMPPPIILGRDAGLTRGDLGLPDDKFLFQFQFDYTGFIERKNPWAAIRAFRKAFPRRGTGAGLVIKTSNSERYPDKTRELEDSVAGDPDITIIHGTFRRPWVISLMRNIDVFLSLHRAEGFGLSPAEAMLLRKPVIATNYSATTEFMNQQNSCLVNYTLVPVQEGQYPHAQEQVWADPDVDHAAWHMRRMFSDPLLRHHLAREAHQTISTNYSAEAAGRRYHDRLARLGLVQR